jgi:Protein of unknown function (DUF1203)
MKLRIRGIPTEDCERLWGGGADANGQPPQARVAEGTGNPCRHCLGLIPAGEPLLILSYRPFPALQPYAETGPIFLHAQRCEHYDRDSMPAWSGHLDPAIVRGYDTNDWIRYETGNVIRSRAIASTCETILADPDIAYVHLRSRFNCFQWRVERG